MLSRFVSYRFLRQRYVSYNIFSTLSRTFFHLISSFSNETKLLSAFHCAIFQSRQQIKFYHTFSIMSRTFFHYENQILLNCSNQICYILNLHYCTSSHFPAVFVRQRKLYYHTEISMSSIIPIFLQSHFSFSLCKKNIVTVQFSISYIRKLSTAAMQLSFTSFHK